jgi:tRNA A-37 threonylcarbamoyl transferase component Bud32
MLGAGGMGAVYLAQHELIGRKVAVKVLLPELSHNEELVSRFFNEARSTATIRHPGLVEVLDFGYLPDSSAYLVMEFLEGETLARLMAREGTLTLPMIWTIGRQITSAVHAANEHGIVHRDIKPDNVFLVPDPEQTYGLRVKVLDFGIAKLTGDAIPATGAKTRTGTVMGTPTYMSPEQCRGAGEVDRRSDVYSLGCVLYEMACGQPPFVKEGLGELIAAHITESPPLPSASDPSLSPSLEGLILEMLAKDVKARPQTMARVCEALDTLVTGAPLPTPAQGSDAPMSASGAQTTNTTLAGEAPPRPRRGKGLFVGLGALVVVVGIASVLLVLRLFGPTEAPAQDRSDNRTDAMTRPSVTGAATTPKDAGTRATPRPRVRVTVHLRVKSEPAGAEVYRAADGLLLGQTPYVHTASPSRGRAVFLVKLPGYKARRVLLAADRDGSVLVRLTPRARARRTSRARPVPRRVPRRVSPKPRRTPMRPPTMRPIRDGVADPFAS